MGSGRTASTHAIPSSPYLHGPQATRRQDDGPGDGQEVRRTQHGSTRNIRSMALRPGGCQHHCLQSIASRGDQPEHRFNWPGCARHSWPRATPSGLPTRNVSGHGNSTTTQPPQSSTKSPGQSKVAQKTTRWRSGPAPYCSW